jgi:hypothetical protein
VDEIAARDIAPHAEFAIGFVHYLRCVSGVTVILGPVNICPIAAAAAIFSARKARSSVV